MGNRKAVCWISFIQSKNMMDLYRFRNSLNLALSRVSEHKFETIV